LPLWRVRPGTSCALGADIRHLTLLYGRTGEGQVTKSPSPRNRLAPKGVGGISGSRPVRCDQSPSCDKSAPAHLP